MQTEIQNLGIEIKGNSPQQKVKCPNCYKIGKENYKDTCLSVNMELGVYNCHKCGWSGKVKEEKLSMGMEIT